MAAIKIPGTIVIDENNGNDSEQNNYESNLVIDPLDNYEDVDFEDDASVVEHADLNLDDIAGDESGYDSAILRIEQEEKLAIHDANDNKFDDSLKHRIRIIALSKIIYPEKHWKIGKYEIDLADTYLNIMGTKYAAQSFEHSKRGTDVMDQFFEDGLNETEKEQFLSVLMMGYFIQARCEMLLKRFNKCYEPLNKAIEVLDKYSKLSIIIDEDLFSWKLKLYQAMGKICIKCQKLSEAEEYLKRSKELVEKNRDESSTMLIPILHLLAQVEQCRGSQNSHFKSISWCLQAHEIANKNHEPHSDEVIQTSMALSTAYSLSDDITSDENARSYLNEVIESLTVRYGSEHEKVLDAQMEMAKLLIRTDYQAEAIVQLKSNLKLQTTLFGEYALELMETNRLLGSLYLSSGDLKLALKYYEEALLIEEIHNSKKTSTYRNMAQVISKIKMNPMFNNSSNTSEKPRFQAYHKPK